VSYRRKNRTDSSFTIVANSLLQCGPAATGGMSFEARGLVAYLLSKPDGWQGQAADIEREGGIKYDRRRTVTIEAEKAGYLKFVTVRRENGQVDQYYEAQETPLPPDDRTKSWEYRKPPTPDKPGSVEPTGGQPTPVQPGAAGRGSIENKELQNKDIQKKEGERPLLTEAELAERTGIKPTADDQLAGQEVLFLTTGKAFCVRKSPELVAWVMNLRRTRGDAGVARVLQALRNPEQHGISRTWATWTIEEALWPTKGRPGAPAAPVANPTRENALLETAKQRWRKAQAMGQTEQDFLAYGTDLSRDIKQRAIEETRNPTCQA